MSTDEQINPLISRKTRIRTYCENYCAEISWFECLKTTSVVIIMLSFAFVVFSILIVLFGFIAINIFNMDTPDDGFFDYMFFCAFVGLPVIIVLLVGMVITVAIGVLSYYTVIKIKYWCSYETINTAV